jgi:hypothetical protein
MDCSLFQPYAISITDGIPIPLANITSDLGKNERTIGQSRKLLSGASLSCSVDTLTGSLHFRMVCTGTECLSLLGYGLSADTGIDSLCYHVRHLWVAKSRIGHGVGFDSVPGVARQNA